MPDTVDIFVLASLQYYSLCIHYRSLFTMYPLGHYFAVIKLLNHIMSSVVDYHFFIIHSIRIVGMHNIDML